MTTKANLVSFAQDLQALLNTYPEVFLSCTADGDLMAYDLDYFNPETSFYKRDLKVFLPRAAEPSNETLPF